MRLVLIGLATLIVALAADVQSGSAQSSKRYCTQGGGFDSSGEADCSFSTWEQCRASASGLGRYCFENPQYRGGSSDVDRRDRTPQRRTGRRR